MQTEYIFDSSEFAPRPSELDPGHDDYINPDVFALELADYLVAELTAIGINIKFRCQEDWGHWMEVDHDGGYTLAIGCSNQEGNSVHRFFVEPSKPVIRKLFKKINVESDVLELVSKIAGILENGGKARNIRVLD